MAFLASPPRLPASSRADVSPAFADCVAVYSWYHSGNGFGSDVVITWTFGISACLGFFIVRGRVKGKKGFQGRKK